MSGKMWGEEEFQLPRTTQRKERETRESDEGRGKLVGEEDERATERREGRKEGGGKKNRSSFCE